MLQTLLLSVVVVVFFLSHYKLQRMGGNIIYSWINIVELNLIE
jgi:hypothetical protein